MIEKNGKITYASDLHLEFGPIEGELPKGGVLVLAGDTCPLSMFSEPGHNRRFITELSENFNHIVYVLGNHEYYCRTIQLERGLDWLKNIPNLHLLNENSVEIDDVIFVGGTLWFEQQLGSYYKFNRLNDSRYLQVEFVEHLHEKCVKAIKRVAREYKDKTVVVVTHHAPHEVCLSPKHSGNDLDSIYFTDLSKVMIQNKNIKAWFCGHTHNRLEHKVEDSECTIYMNCRGYSDYEKMAETFKFKEVEIN